MFVRSCERRPRRALVLAVPAAKPQHTLEAWPGYGNVLSTHRARRICTDSGRRVGHFQGRCVGLGAMSALVAVGRAWGDVQASDTTQGRGGFDSLHFCEKLRNEAFFGA